MFKDFKELLSAFNAHQVRYLIVGGYAVSRVLVEIEDGLIVPFISREDLVAAKLSAGRPEDLADVAALQAAQDVSNKN